jgi:hypothetical protein
MKTGLPGNQRSFSVVLQQLRAFVRAPPWHFAAARARRARLLLRATCPPVTARRYIAVYAIDTVPVFGSPESLR